MAKTSSSNGNSQKILIVGAYGLIGYEISKRLLADDYEVTGLGRNLQTGQRVLPDIEWIERDMKALCDAQDWSSVLEGVSVVVNCSGALQDGPEDNLEIVHHYAVSALANACAFTGVALIQISAVGAKLNASTPFLSSKARGDEAIRLSGANYHIFRPGLVLASNAYGGSAMLRMLAAVPFFLPIAKPEASIQTVAVNDVADAVAAAIAGKIPYGFEGDLVEDEVHSLRDVVLALQNWLGFRSARYVLELPDFALVIISRLADFLSRFGWKSPLRSTAVTILNEGIQGKPVDMTQFGLQPVSSLQSTLSNMPVGVQDRLYARMALLTPIIISSLCLFWLISGLVGLMNATEAAHLLKTAGWPSEVALASVVFWSVIDITIGMAFIFRKYANFACWTAVWVSVFYLCASTIVVPSLWTDPLGPLVKIVPGIVLAIVARAALDTR